MIGTLKKLLVSGFHWVNIKLLNGSGLMVDENTIY
jgi:hypothetical protein